MKTKNLQKTASEKYEKPRRTNTDNIRLKSNQETEGNSQNAKNNAGNFELIFITTKGNNRRIRIDKKTNKKVHVITETQLSPSLSAEDIYVSAKPNNFLCLGQGVTHQKDIHN